MSAGQIGSPADIVGTWRLVAYIFAPDDGGQVHPYGENPTGLITYTADGYMHVAIMDTSRATYDANDFQGGSIEQQPPPLAPTSPTAAATRCSPIASCTSSRSASCPIAAVSPSNAT